jgi:hypothetical protein
MDDNYAPIEKFATCRYSLEFMTPLMGVQQGTMVVRRDIKETIGEHTYIKFVTVFSGIPGAEQETSFSRKGSDGVYSIDGKDRDKTEYRVTALPLEVGKSWKYATPNRSCDCRVEAMETAELLESRYERSLRVACNCRRGFESESTVTYLAPGLGMVKQTGKAPGVSLEVALQECK